MIDYSNVYGQVEPESKTSWIARIVHNDKGHSHLDDGTSMVLWEHKYPTSMGARSQMMKKLTFYLSMTPEYTDAQQELNFDNDEE